MSRSLVAVVTSLCTIAVCIALHTWATHAEGPTEDLPAGIVARVGDRTISAEDVLARIYEWEEPLDTDRKHLHKAYQFLINDQLLRAEAQSLGVVVSEEQKNTATDQQIQALKDLVKREWPGLDWASFLESRKMDEATLRAQVHGNAERILLRRRVVKYWEMMTPLAVYVQIRLGNEKDAGLMLAKIDNAMADREAAIKASPDDKHPSRSDVFQKLAILESSSGDTLKSALKGQGLPPVIEKAIFEEIAPDSYSPVLKVADGDFRILFVQTRTSPVARPYADMARELEASTEDIDEGRFTRWAALMFNTGKYQSRYRIPGR